MGPQAAPTPGLRRSPIVQIDQPALSNLSSGGLRAQQRGAEVFKTRRKQRASGRHGLCLVSATPSRGDLMRTILVALLVAGLAGCDGTIGNAGSGGGTGGP